MEVVSEETRQKYYNQALQFAFSYFINGEYAIRKAYFSDTFNKSLLDELTKLKKNFIEIFGIDNSPFVLQSFIDYSLFFEYPDESSPFSSFFFKRYTKKINSLSIESKDIEKIYRIYKNDKSNFIKKLVSFTLISGIYPSDLLFPFEKNILDLPITPENFIRYSFQHVPHTSNILGYNNYIKFIDNSDNFNSIYQDKNPEYKFLLNFEANNFDINEVKNIISNIYYFYKLENILDNFDIFIYQNNIAIKELIPRYVKRLTDNQMKNRLYALYIWDRIEFHNDKFSTCIKQFESITENRNVYDTIKHQFENTKKSRAFPN